MKRLILLIGLAIGYVLGSKAGREQYRKIKATASKTWQSPAVRSAAEKVETFVGEKAPAFGGVAHTVFGGGSTSGSDKASGGNGASGSGSASGGNGASGSGNGGPGAGSTDTGFSETGSATAGAPSPDVVADVDLGNDLTLDTDLGNEGERPA